jgi:hypothetical protein
MLKDKKEVIKHSAAIQVENRISLLERRAWNVLLANAYDELPTAETHRIAVTDLTRVLGYTSRNHLHLRETLKSLTSAVLEWNIVHKDKEVWGATTLLAEVEIEDGVCTYAFGPTLRKRLYNPKMYARISLSLQNLFQSKHTLALYELCIDYLHEESNLGQTPFISIQDFRKLMGIPEGMYPEFKKLNQYVIKEPLEEINGVTDLTVTAEYKKEGRSVVAVKFRFRRTLQLPGKSAGQEELFPETEALPAIVQELIAVGLSRNNALDIWQSGAAVVEADPKPDPEVFEAYIREKIHLLKRRQASSRVTHSTGFLLDAIRKNYTNPEFAEETKQKEARQQAQDRKAKVRELAALQEQREQVKRSHSDALHAHCQAMIAASPTLLKEAVAVLHAQDYIFRQHYEPDKTPAENYEARLLLWLAVDRYLEEQYPERFQALYAVHHAELTAIDAKMATLEQAVI